MALIGKVLPTTLTGDKSNPIEVAVSFERRKQAVEAARAAFAEQPKE